MSRDWRLGLVLILFVLMSGTLLARLFDLQVIEHKHYEALAKNQHQITKKVFPERGRILMQDLSSNQEEYVPLAIDKEFYQAYLIPKEVPSEKKQELADRLVEILEIEKDSVMEKINKQDDPYEPLKHKISGDKVEEIQAIDIKGVGVLPETWRYYPYGDLASHLVGFVSREGENRRVGRYGIEKSFQDKLAGEAGMLEGSKDTSGFYIPFGEEGFKPAVDGEDLVLTIDENIQFRAEKELKRAVEKYEAEGGSIIVMDPQTGAVRAMAALPRFNPNQYNRVEDMGVFINPATQKVYEPGSVFKPITMAAGLDSGKIKPETVYEDKGSIQIDDRVITNVDGKAYGEQNMTQVLEKSLNTGAVFVQRKTGKQDFRTYVQDFGFDKPTGIALPGEVGGDIFNLFTERQINLANISFGQGISVTPLGLLTAISTIANQGKMMQPFIVEKRINSEGEEIITEPELKKQVISKETSEELTRMMVSVVDNGFGAKAAVEGYNVAGKTGTAQVPDPKEGGYLEDDTIHSFVGFAPAFDPGFTILVKLDKPQEARFSSDSAAAVFGKMAEYLLNYFEIPPK